MAIQMEDITLVLGVDRQHLNELRWAWETWMRFKPELKRMPLIVFYDASQIGPGDLAFVNGHANFVLVPWDWEFGRNQREKMLTGWVHIPALHVKTPWYLKIDTDCVATGHGEWIKEEWFLPGPCGRLPVFIGTTWGHTKPRYAMDLLDDWADGVPQLERFPRLNLPYSSTNHRLKHDRVASWVFFCRADWTREVTGWLTPDGRLPFPSQDTFLFYCAKRGGQWYVGEDMTRYYWRHMRFGKLPHLCATAVAGESALSEPASAQECPGGR